MTLRWHWGWVLDILFPKSLAVRLVSNCHPVVSGVLGATLNLRRSKDPVAKSHRLCVKIAGVTNCSHLPNYVVCIVIFGELLMYPRWSWSIWFVNTHWKWLVNQMVDPYAPWRSTLSHEHPIFAVTHILKLHETAVFCRDTYLSVPIPSAGDPSRWGKTQHLGSTRGNGAWKVRPPGIFVGWRP